METEVIDEKTVRVFGNVGRIHYDSGDVVITFLHDRDSVPFQQLGVDKDGGFETVVSVRGDGVYTVRATYFGVHAETWFATSLPESTPAPELPLEPDPPPETEPAPAEDGQPEPDPWGSRSYDGINRILVAVIPPAMENVASLVRVLLADGPSYFLIGAPLIDFFIVMILIVVFIAGFFVLVRFLWKVPDPGMAARSRPDARRQRSDPKQEAARSRSAGAGREQPDGAAPPRTGRASLGTARPVGTTGIAPTMAPRAPGIKAERDEMRRLLGSGIIIPDTNICVNHMYHKVSDPGITPAVLDHVKKRLENRADDTAHECLDEAMDQKRVKFPYVIPAKELEGHLRKIETEALSADTVTLEDLDIASLISGMRKSPLFEYSTDPEHILAKCSDATADRIRRMYEGFRDLDETKRAVASVIERGKEFPPAGGDIYILGSAAELAAGGADVRLLTLDSDFTEFAAQVERELRVKVIDGNPYIRKGKDFFDRNDYARAAEYLWEGTDLNKGSRYGLAYLAKALFRLGEHGQGKRVMNRIAVDENDYLSVVKMADLQMLAKEYYEAAIRFGAASRLKPDMAYPLGRRGRALMQLAEEMEGKQRADNMLEAEELLERAKEIEPGNPHVEQDLRTVRKRRRLG